MSMDIPEKIQLFTKRLLLPIKYIRGVINPRTIAAGMSL
jgi:hypothetical protein